MTKSETQIAKNLGVLLRAARRGRTLQDMVAVARDMGINLSATQASEYENGKRLLSMPRFYDICKVYGLKPGGVITRLARMD